MDGIFTDASIIMDIMLCKIYVKCKIRTLSTVHGHCLH